MPILETTPAQCASRERRPAHRRPRAPATAKGRHRLPRLGDRVRRSERGFTFIELLVVILLVGILAAIALPAFLSQQRKGQDAEAKSTARNAMSLLESCYAERESYVPCGTASEFAGSGLALGNGQNQVDLSGLDTDDYVISVLSRSGTTFTITKSNGGAPSFSW